MYFVSIVPEVKGSLEFTANQTTGVVRLNWATTFRPNGPVQRYTLTRNGIALLSRPTTSVVLSNEPRATGIHYIKAGCLKQNISSMYRPKLCRDNPDYCGRGFD